MALLAPIDLRAITIADGFTYGGTNGFAASSALAQDYGNYPIFEAVGWFRLDLSDGRSSRSSGTLLNNEWVLTAGHSLKPPGEVSSLSFVLAGVTNVADLSSIVMHPLWSAPPPPLIDGVGSPSQGWDVALFRLASPITNTSLREVPLVWDVHQKIPNEIQCAPSDEINLAGQVCSPNQGRASACGRHFVLLRFERLRSQRSNSGIWQHGIQPVFVRCCHVARRVHRNGDITHRASRTSAGRIGIACSGGGEPWRWWWSAPKGVSAD